MNSIGFLKLSELAFIPYRHTNKAAGLDLRSPIRVTIPANGRACVLLDLAVTLPANCYGRIAPRSGLALKECIDVAGGVIDADFAEPEVSLIEDDDNDKPSVPKRTHEPSVKVSLKRKRNRSPSPSESSEASSGDEHSEASDSGSESDNSDKFDRLFVDEETEKEEEKEKEEKEKEKEKEEEKEEKAIEEEKGEEEEKKEKKAEKVEKKEKKEENEKE
ncbi:nucleolar protein 58-like [Macrosteles quadrilineatus]|uniref:nucleolar protein 58-like n=1 Tax=Macrosteles quadrilineatus TaxID=74068 RepID=UPI0023E2CB74|nr:nucleolar protein 58-like [Macrosteles quadrilineatus]